MSTPLILENAETGEGPPLVILHGLFGSRRNWGLIAKRLASARRVIVVDLRNHGASPWADSMDYRAMAGDVLALIDLVSPATPVEIIGHSMGGKVLMTLALTAPERVSRPVVVDIGPVTYDEGFSTAYAAKMRVIDPALHASRQDVDAALAESVPDPTLRGFLMTNLAREGDHFRWTVNLDAIIASQDDLLGFPPLDDPFEGSALFVAGGRSNYLHTEAEKAAKALFPACRIVRLKDAGHWVHADAPEALAETVAAYLGIAF